LTKVPTGLTKNVKINIYIVVTKKIPRGHNVKQRTVSIIPVLVIAQLQPELELTGFGYGLVRFVS